MLWTEKYAPKGVEDFAGNPSAREETVKWALDWKRGKKGRPLLLSGPTGSGKTALVKAVAASAGWEILDVEKADVKDDKRLRALFSGSGLYGTQSLLLVDAVDARFKQSEVTKLVKFAEDAGKPVVFTLEDLWNRKVGALRNACMKIALKRVNWLTIRKIVKKISDEERVEANNEGIARAAGGDLRAAINDLQGGSWGERNKKLGAFEAIRKVFKKNYAEAMRAKMDFDGNWDFFVKWVQENTPREYDIEETAKAMNWLSRGDVFAGRIRKRQDYGLLRYVNALSVGGVAASKKCVHNSFTPYAFPSDIRALSSSKASRYTLKELCSKIGGKLHLSRHEAMKTLPLLSLMKGTGEYFELDKKEAKLLAEFG